MDLPSEMTGDTKDRILMLYDGSQNNNYFAVTLTFTGTLTAKIEYYNNTT